MFSVPPPHALLCPHFPAEDSCVVTANEKTSSHLFLSLKTAGVIPACKHVITWA